MPGHKEDIGETKRRIRDAVGLIRSRVKDGHLLLQHNLEYGFIRNLFGGSILAFVVSVVSILLYDIHSRQFIVSAVLGVVYLLTLALRAGPPVPGTP